jgi:hypothetical protein
VGGLLGKVPNAFLGAPAALLALLSCSAAQDVKTEPSSDTQAAAQVPSAGAGGELLGDASSEVKSQERKWQVAELARACDQVEGANGSALDGDAARATRWRSKRIASVGGGAFHFSTDGAQLLYRDERTGKNSAYDLAQKSLSSNENAWEKAPVKWDSNTWRRSQLEPLSRLMGCRHTDHPVGEHLTVLEESRAPSHPHPVVGVDLDKGETFRLLPEGYSIMNPGALGDGKRVRFFGWPPDERPSPLKSGRLYISDLTTRKTRCASAPIPDGAQLYFLYHSQPSEPVVMALVQVPPDHHGNPVSYEVHALDLDQGMDTTILKSTRARPSSALMMPHGEGAFVLTRDEKGASRLLRVDLRAGKQKVQVLGGKRHKNIVQFALSPDGRHLAYRVETPDPTHRPRPPKPKRHERDPRDPSPKLGCDPYPQPCGSALGGGGGGGGYWVGNGCGDYVWCESRNPKKRWKPPASDGLYLMEVPTD